MPVTVEEFTERLTQSGLFSAEELAAFQESLPPEKKPKDVQGLARELIRAGRLTKFQAEAVYRGRVKGLVMGEYVVLDRIGAGGMGEVLKARHRRMDRIVALKVLPRKAMQSEDSVKRFYREVTAAAKLTHPNIVIAHDASECDGIHYLVMEFVDGRDLAQVVKQQGPLSVDEAVDCTIQTARGLAYAHGEGVIHRDIKPGNLLLDKSGTVKILDMGLARVALATDDEPERLTGTGQVMGTCDYMAPEQAEDTHTADHRADIYSLGCTLYRLLTGRPPYQGDSLIKILLAHREAPVPSLRDVRLDVPEPLDAVYQKMLAKRPEDRYQSMDEVIEALELCCKPQEAPLASRAEGSSDSALTTFPDRLAEPGSSKPASTTPPKADETMPSQVLDDTGTSVKRPAARPAKPKKAAKPARPPRSPEKKREIVRNAWIAGGAALSLVLLGLLIVVLRGGNSSSPLPQAGEGPGVRAVSQTDTPPAAQAPFTAQQARWYQQQWADHLGLPVEWTNSVGMQFVLIPPGEFMMGSTEEEVARLLKDAERQGVPSWYADRVPAEMPKHRVQITRPFYLGICEVTQAEYEGVTGSNPSRYQDDSNRPVERVTWPVAAECCRKLSELPREKAACAAYRLPTEAQWEYACRAGTTTHYGFGNDVEVLDQYAWWGRKVGQAQPVGRLKPNAFGLFDMHGNVWEWCADRYASEYYGDSPREDPPGPDQGTSRLWRGGSWSDGSAAELRCALRLDIGPDHCADNIGFRVVCEIPTDPAELAKFAAAIKEVKAESGREVRQVAPSPGQSSPRSEDGWQWLFDGTSLDGWEEIEMEGNGEVSLVDRCMQLGQGPQFTAVGWRGNAARSDYEIAFQSYFLDEKSGTPCGLVFPVSGARLMLNLSTGGGHSGLQFIDEQPGHANETATKPLLQQGKWYRILLRVLGPRVQVFVDDRSLIDFDATGHALRATDEVFPDTYGLCLFSHKGGCRIRDVRMRSLLRENSAGTKQEFDGMVTLPNGWQVGRPVNLGPVVNSSDLDGSPALSPDGLTLLFGSDRPGGQGSSDLWMSSRASSNEPFGEPVNLGPIVNSSEREDGPAFSPDGLTLLFSSTRPAGGQGRGDLWMCSRAGVSDSFGKPVNLGAIINHSGFDLEPVLSPHGLTLFWGSDRPGGQGGRDLWMSSRASPSDLFGQPVNLSENVNSSEYESSPSLSPDGLTLLFCSDRLGGEGGKDLWMSNRARGDELFSQPVNLGPTINSSKGETSPALSPDGRALFFHSDRPGGQGVSDLWMAPIEPPGTAFSLPGKPAPPLAVAPFDAEQAKKHQQVWADYLGVPVEQDVDLGGGVKLAMMLIPPGEFMMGSTKEQLARYLEEAKAAGEEFVVERLPAEGSHRVRITRPFRLGRHEVTRGQFRQFVEETGYKTDAERDGQGGYGKTDDGWVQDQRFFWSADLGFPQTDDHPVTNISWNDATAFCRWLTKKAGVEYTLPTEAQWEYACRAGTTTAWHCGDDSTALAEYAWCRINAQSTIHPVGKLKPNGWSLYDMHGHMREWCADTYNKEYYAQSPRNDPGGHTTGSHRVNRGGCWFIPAGRCRSAYRGHELPGIGNHLGFRLASILPDDVTSVKAKPKAPAATAGLPNSAKNGIAPPRAVAPFDATQAKTHQQAWADHLGVPVEKTNSLEMKFVLIPPGEFMMGDANGKENEKPAHKVTITRPYYLGQFEVTVGQFRKFVEATGYKTEAERFDNGWTDVKGKWGPVPGTNWRKPKFSQEEDHPVCVVSLKDIEVFCDWASKQTGAKVYLPTEAQWEYACRAGTTTRFNTGDTDSDLDRAAWRGATSGGKTHPVGQKMPNAWSLHDMHGNVWDMVGDWFDKDYYAKSPAEDPPGPSSGDMQIIRGGGWGDSSTNCRCAARRAIEPQASIGNGFRVAMEVPTADSNPRTTHTNH